MKFPSLKALNPEEALIGAIFALPFAFKIGWLVCLLSPICAYLWASGGTKKEDGGNKAYRRVGCALLPCIFAFLTTHNLQVFLAFPMAWVVLSCGYGIQSTQPPDNGSWLGRFWFEVTSEDEWWASFFTRLTIYVLLTATFIPVWIS